MEFHPDRSALPTFVEAQQLLNEAERLNPGPWVQHSRHVAEAAGRIAACVTGMDASNASIIALLHDIGRREGVTDMRHALDGYRYLAHLGYPWAARICLTHSCPVKDARAGSGKWDCSAEELEFVQDYLRRIEFDAYDRLIQLCDCLASPDGFCRIEVRLVDVTLRHGFNEFTLDKWRAFFAIQREFEQLIGGSIYALFPEME